MTIQQKLGKPGTRKLLALDGGGIRGALTIEILAKIERLLQDELGRDDTFVLSEYFDYIGGTSTGAIIATCLSMGFRIDYIRKFYEESGAVMFDKANLLKRFRFKYEKDNLTEKLKEVFGADTKLGDEKLKTLLLLVMRNATTDSPWPVSNNPAAKYNLETREDSNLKFPLWQLVRASTAAPTYFPPETIEVGKHNFIFVDGGVTMYNNPAFQLFLMATVQPYAVNWSTGENNMLVVSIGTGSAANANEDLAPGEMNLLYNASSIPSALMYAASNEQDFLCRVFGKCRHGDELDREVGDMCNVKGPIAEKMFSYMRYNADLSEKGLKALGLPHIKPENVQQMDSVDFIGELQEVGKAVADQKVKNSHFDGFIK
jgi:patatin-like phospholipase/acyl hydrolase